MSLKPLKPIRNTIGLRLTLWYSGILILSVMFLFGLTYFLLSASLKDSDQTSIRLKLEELASIYQTSGITAMEREVAAEKKFEKKPAFFIRLVGPRDRTRILALPYQWVELDLKKLEKSTAAQTSMLIRLPLKNNAYQMEIQSVRLADGYLLQVGKSNEERTKIMGHFRSVFIWVVVPLILCGFIGGAFVAFRALRPIRSLIDTVRSIESGQMNARVPSLQTGDELDELSMLFNEMLSKIESLINGMGAALDNVAHDLRTPMTRFRGMAEIALQSGQKPENLREALSDCLEESERILDMLNTLMDISEAETGAMKLNLSKIDVSGMIENVVELYRYVAEEKGVELSARTGKGLCVSADPARISQALANLLDNAVKYTPAGSRIELEAFRQQGHVVMKVKDFGIGILQDELPKIWDRLYRGDQSRSQKGLGLGLSLVRAVVQAHNGSVEVFSEPEKGSTFQIILSAID
jgi:heavy metal sensor kinase